MDIVIPIVTAAIGAIGGYLGKSRLAAAELQKVHAENQGLRDQREHEQFQHRQRTYHELLNVDSKLADRFREPADRWDAVFYIQQQEKLAEYVNGVAVFGKAEVNAAAQELLTAQVGGNRDEVDKARAKLIEAMRRDVAPD